MTLVVTIGEQLKAAMKAGDARRRDTLRLVQSALKNFAIEKRKPLTELSDEEVFDVMKRLVKQRKDSIEQYRAGGREDLVEQESYEIDVLSEYLPAALSDEALGAIVDEALFAMGPLDVSAMGKAMGAVMKAVAGRADGDRVRALVEGHIKNTN